MKKGIQILVTDGDSGVREAFRMVLKDTYKVLVADCGKECLKIVKQGRVQLVILDVSMPDMNGLKALREIKQINASLAVIVIMGMGTHKVAVEALKLGADDFIGKPLDFYYVKDSIARSLSKKDKEATAIPSIENIISRNYLSSLKVLNKILEARDSYTREHSKKVSEYSVKIAEELGLSLDEQEVVKEAALLHDIGKVGISEFILNKRGKLNAQEWAEVRRHTLIGEKILEPLKVLHIEQSMIRHHHERYDGKGYPDHLRKEEIPLYARILAVADAYDAMNSSRRYRRALSPIEALTEIERCSGTQFDPKVVQAFAMILRKDKKLLK